MKTKRILAAILSATIFITSYSINGVQAATDIPTQPAPSNLAITALNPGTQPPIGYSSSDGGESGYYADMGWQVANPTNLQGISFAGKYVNIYLEESAKGYRAARNTAIKDMPGDSKPIRIRNLNSGTIYKANARAYYEYTEGVITTKNKSPESTGSNTVKFLTNINLQCITMGTDKIKIIWDDVWNDGNRINYKLYVSENKDFTNTLPIYITDEQISEQGPVTVNKTDGTLEYTHSVRDSGRVYYVKVVPEISNPEIIKSAESPTVLVSTYILVKTTRMSTTNDGSIIWRLDWSPVVTGISSSNIKVQYRIDKYDANNQPIPMFVEDSTTTFITVPSNEPVSSYIIRANVTKDGIPLYPDNIKIVSAKITLKEDEVSSTPTMPELVPVFKDLGGTGAVIISYEDIVGVDGSIITKGELRKDTATVLWRAPKRADGTIDANMLYDIWLIEDPNTIDLPAVETKIKTSFKPADANYVKDAKDNNSIVGYKYKLEGLLPNHTYYFKVVAKKVFVENVDGVIQNVERTSTPALKVVITLPGGSIDTPLIPSNPPLEIKKYSADDERRMITDNSVTIQTKNRWYEQFNKVPNTGKWYYVKADKIKISDNIADGTLDYNPTNPLTPVDNIKYRKVQYDPGVSLYVGCEEYTEGMDITTIENYKLEKVPTLPNDEVEKADPSLNAPENTVGTPAYAPHNVIIPVNELKPNTTYILWVRAARDGDPTLFSDVSNPIIFTTLPAPSQTVEKPVVPTINYTFVGDTFADLGWDYKDGNQYYIKYATVDDLSKAGNAITVTTSQIMQSGVNYVRIPGLKSDTKYFFWIQAEAFSEDFTTSEKSDWSDSTPLRTLKDIPPTTPRGFGVKNAADAVTKNSVTFEWIKENNLEYVLEVASGVDYKDVKEYKIGAVSEFKVDGLKSNVRYFARLYAYDSVKKLTSLPTQSVSVRTQRSSDDYDSDQDVDNVISGEFIDKATKVVNGTWVIKIVGVNADRLIELMMTDNKLDYTVDVSKPPSAASYISIYVSKKVFDKLQQLKENIAFKTSAVSYNLKAGILSNVNTDNTNKEQIYLFSLTLSPLTPVANTNELLLKRPMGKMDVSLDTGVSNFSITEFGTPLVVKYPYTNRADYVEDKTYGYLYNTVRSDWEKQSTLNEYDSDNNSGIISFQAQAPGLYGVAERTTGLFDDIYGHEYEDSIINVAFIHKLKSVNGRMFEPNDNATVGEAVKIIFDTIDGYSYSSEYMESAVKAGLIKANKLSSTICTRQEAACMATVLYEIKSGSKGQISADVIKSYSDYSKIDKTLLNKVTFAVENGFVPDAASNKLNPTDPVTRGELMYMIEKALALAGELE